MEKLAPCHKSPRWSSWAGAYSSYGSPRAQMACENQPSSIPAPSQRRIGPAFCPPYLSPCTEAFVHCRVYSRRHQPLESAKCCLCPNPSDLAGCDLLQMSAACSRSIIMRVSPSFLFFYSALIGVAFMSSLTICGSFVWIFAVCCKFNSFLGVIESYFLTPLFPGGLDLFFYKFVGYSTPLNTPQLSIQYMILSY